MNIEIQNTPQNIVSLVTPKLKLLPEFFNNIVPASASGEKVGFMNTVGLPLRFIDVATEIVAQQDLNGYDHPWASGGNGIQIWDEEWESGGIKTSNGQNETYGSAIRSKNYIPIDASKEYYVKAPANFFPFFYDENKNYIGYSGAGWKNAAKIPSEISNSLAGGSSFANAKYMRFRCDTGGTYANNISINYPSTDTAYHPWANICPITGFNTGNIIVSPTENQGDGTTYIVAWHSEAGTVYGGEVDVTKGKLRKTFGFVDLGDLTWEKYGSAPNYKFSAPLPLSKDYLNYHIANAICSNYLVIAFINLASNDKHFSIGQNTLRNVCVFDSALSDLSAEDFKTAMDGVQLVYELDTPVEYDITPVDAIKMLNGQNFVWSNTGNISVVYYKKVGANDNVQTLMRSSAPSLGMERQEVEDRPFDDIRLGDGLIREAREPIEREEIEDEPVEIAEEEPQDEKPVEEPQEEA